MNSPQTQDWEARWARPTAIAAFLAVIPLIGAEILRQAVVLDSPPSGDDPAYLRAVNDASAALVASGVFRTLSFFVMVAVLLYLLKATQARRPEVPSFVQPILLAGPVLLLVAGVLSDLTTVDVADEFLASGARTDARAEDLRDDVPVFAVALGSGGTLAFSLGFLFVSLNAMRVGLLSRFMGIIGVMIGVLFVFFTPLAALLMVFWLPALGLLLLDRWPGGRGPAWESGQAEPWPSALERGREVEEPEPVPPEPEEQAPQKRKRRGR